MATRGKKVEYIISQKILAYGYNMGCKVSYDHKSLIHYIISRIQ